MTIHNKSINNNKFSYPIQNIKYPKPINYSTNIFLKFMSIMQNISKLINYIFTSKEIFRSLEDQKSLLIIVELNLKVP